jgi:hypothetical protein
MQEPSTALKSAHSPRAAKLLSSLQFQGKSNDCGPYTTATVINTLLNLNLDAAQLAREMERVAWRGPFPVVRRVPNWATFPWGMADVFRDYGLHATWRFFRKPQYLQEKIPQGKVLMPVIGSWRPIWAHVMTLVAWDAEKGWGFANTQYDHHEITWLDDSTFRRRWRAMANLLVEVDLG